ncbi:MAG: queuosine precursor transporter, partial [Spirochaetaceae bacterium]|nr:queuosine precursor transporter [Spirochaetaceae bacterium]
KVKTNGKHLWLRTISSTLAGQLLDSVIFVTIAFAGLYPVSVLITMAVSNYLLKTVIEVVFTPITYGVINTTKRIEGIDTFDNGENYNPLPNK